MGEAALVVGFVAAVVALSSLARLLRTPAPLLLLLVGAALSFVPGLPELRISQELVLVGLLPPLLYAAAIRTSVVDLKANRITILLLSVVLVALTALGVGVVVWTMLGVPFALAVVLGGVVAPPDAVAASAVARRVGMPRRLVTILEGESLFNDASALVIVRTGLAALAVGVTPWQVGVDFLWASGGGVAVGLLVAAAVRAVRARVTKPVTDTALAFLCPWLAYLPAEAIHASGILSVVVCGVILGHKAARFQSALSRTAERINWGTVQYVLENAVFLLIGLQVHAIVRDVAGEKPGLLLGTCLAVLASVVVIRLLAVMVFVPLWRSPTKSASEAFRAAAVTGWAGMRGVVTLAAALVIPADAPARPVLVLLALVVTVGTLVIQGYSLPWVIRRSGLRRTTQRETDLETAELVDRVVAAGMARLAQADEPVTEPVGQALRASAERRVHGAWERLETSAVESTSAAYRRLRAEMLAAERETWLAARDEGRFSSDVLDAVLASIDLEESMIVVLGRGQSSAGAEDEELVARSPHACAHLAAVRSEPVPTSDGCRQCLVDGTTWVALRMCLDCGTVGCCDSSVGRHATAHFRTTGHPVMRSIMPGEAWRWCYVDQQLG
ncbi:MAG TPA: cation:proton antiporter [Propionibacteriaceae bacterium]|nr:cation:proton antiporter [Propionibacteriaceae bacterium]